MVAQKVALGPFSPVETSVFRGLGALAILVPLWIWKEGGGRFSKNDWGMFGLLGLGVLGNHLLVLFGLQFIGAGAAGVIIGASPAITAFLSSLILKDVPLRYNLAGMFGFLCWGGGGHGTERDGGRRLQPCVGRGIGPLWFGKLGPLYNWLSTDHGSILSFDCDMDDPDDVITV